jgi:hypothetical protein
MWQPDAAVNSAIAGVLRGEGKIEQNDPNERDSICFHRRLLLWSGAVRMRWACALSRTLLLPHVPKDFGRGGQSFYGG